MTNFAIAFKTEISRVAKKEARAEAASVKKTSAKYRSEIADLKRRIAQLETTVKRLAGASATPKTEIVPLEKEPSNRRFGHEGFAKLRIRLGLSAQEMAKLLGVSNQSVYHWESGKSRPRAAQLAAIAEIRKISRKEAAQRLGAM